MVTSDIAPPSSTLDILIVGGGPVGLLAANLFVQAGMSVRVLDIEHEPNHWGRGDWIHGRTLELLERANLTSELLDTGVKVEKMTSYLNDKLQREIPFVPEETESKHEYLLCVGQHITESSLQGKLSRKDVQVERPSTVVKMVRVDDDEYPMHATVMHVGDKRGYEEVRCKYILGCDGAHSDIRQQLGISNEGETSETHAGVLDAMIRTNHPSKKDVCIIQNDHTKTISMFPRENGLTRIFVHFSENEHEQRKEAHNRNKIQVEDIQREAKRALLPHRIDFLGILYWSVYVVGQRFAEKLDAEDLRVFLCGDAAHSQSPTLGQGLNTGFGDIFNLAWKICMVEKGQMNRKNLSTYQTERWPVAQNVLNVDRVAAKAAAGHEATDYCKVVEEHRAFTAGFGVKYEADSLLSYSTPKTQSYTLQPGIRAPNYKVYSYATGKKTRLFDVVVKDDRPLWLSFTLLVLASDLQFTFEKVSAFLNETSKNAASLPHMNVVVVTTSTADRILSYKESLDSDRVVIDKLNQAQCHRAYHRKTESVAVKPDELQVALIRPDGYIGTILRGDTDPSSLSNSVYQYFSNIM
ncbi:FAD binding domain-containing protein [Sporodiniella umbellata]|nr:FAD binding domain-containing protein [Sporodiniella umbellata]